MIRLTVPSMAQDDLEAVASVLQTGFLVQGAQVAAFERAVAGYVGVKYAVAVSNGTAALHLSLLALDVRPGDLVVTTAYSWPATANVVELCGAQPVFVDIRPDTFNMDPEALAIVLERLMANSETARRVRVILPVHAFGQLADMPAILELATHYGLPLVEDAACALGAALEGRQAGAWGAMGCFSFHPRKAITTGEGGMVTTDDPALARQVKMLRNHGLDPEAVTPEFLTPGFNYRLTEFQGALGLTQLAKLERIIAARRERAARYAALLADTPFSVPVVAPGHEPVYQSYVVLLPPELAAHRAELIQTLKVQGIETTIGTWHIPLTAYYRTRYGYRPGDFPATDAVFARALTLPLHETLTEEEQAQVVENLLWGMGV